MIVKVHEHNVEIEKTPINEKEINVTKCQFVFDETIPSNYVKEAYFTFNGNSYKKIIQNNECDIPYEVLQERGQVELGVVPFEVQDEQTIKRFNPSPDYFDTWSGSLKEAENSEPITPSEMEQYEQQLQEGLNAIDDKIDEVDTKIETIDDKLDEVDTAIEETNNLDIDIDKQDKETTITLTKKDGTTKSESVLDGKDLQFVWRGTELGVKTSDMQDYQYTNLQGVQGETGPMGAPFTIKKTYSTIDLMKADYDNMEVNDYVMIDGNIEEQDNAKMFVKQEVEDPVYRWHYLADFSGATGIKGETGATPNIQIGSVTSGDTPSVTRTGTDENPVLNFVLKPGPTGATGPQGPTGDTGNGIANIQKTSSSGLVDTYTITYTDGTTQTYEVTNGEDGEVTQSQLDEVIAENDYLNSIIDQIVPKTTATGTSITLEDTLQARMNMELNPSELKQETTTGKNLFDGLLEQGNYDSATGEKTPSNVFYRNTNIIKVEPNTTYTFSINGVSQRYVILEYGTNKNFISQNSSLQTGTFTTSSTTYYINFRCFQSDYTDNYANLKIQLEVGSTATAWEKFTGGIPSPNPSYPQDIHTISGDNTIKVVGKNKLNNYAIVKGRLDNGIIGYESNTTALSVSDNSISFTTNANYRGVVSDFIPIETSDYIFFTWESATTTPACAVNYYDENKNYISANSGYSLTNALRYSNAVANAKYIRLYISLNTAGTQTINKAQVRFDSDIPTYEPYQEQKAQVNLGDLEYCKMPNTNYSDEFYKATDSDTSLISGKWYIKKNIGKVVLDGTEYWSINSSTENYTEFQSYNVLNPVSPSSYNFPISNYFSNTAYNRTVSNAGLLLIRVPASENITTIENFKTWLSTHNTEVYYVLATPTYTLLNDTLQSQLDTIESMLLSYKGQTSISQVNNDLPFIMTSTALKEL